MAAQAQAAMPKTIHRTEYRVLLQFLRERRIAAGLTQVQCATRLGWNQSFVSEVERGTKRLDLIQLRDFCKVLKTDLPKFVRDFERELRKR